MPAGIGFATDQIKSLPRRLTPRRRLALVVLLVTTAAALAGSILHTRSYTATAEVVLPAAGREQLLATAFAQQPSEQVVARRTARALDGLSTAEQIEREVEIDGNQASVVLRAEDSDATVAAQVASEFARQYASAQVDLAYRAVLQGGTAAGQGTQNLVPNGGFEEGSEGWVPIQEPSPGWGVSTEWAAGGEASLRARSDGPRTGSATLEGVGGMPVEGDAPYTLSAVVSVSVVGARPSYLRLRWSAISGALISYSPRLYLEGPGTARVGYTKPVRSPRDAAYARIELIAEPAPGQAADIYLDDVRLARVGAVGPVPSPGRAARLTLASLRSGALVEPAAVPSEPSEPRVRSTLLIALLVGSFAALAVATLTRRGDAS